MLNRLLIVLIALVCMLAVPVALAQESTPDPNAPATEDPAVPTTSGGLDPAAETNFGQITLSAGLNPDPYIVTVISGGDLDVASLNLGTDCTGFTTTNPDFQFTLQGAFSRVRFFFVSEGDTTLIVRAPDGTFSCSDDFAGIDPLVEFETAAEGEYDIWIGSFNQGAFVPGYLMVTEKESEPGAIDSPLLGTLGTDVSFEPSFATGLDPDSTPSFGTADLAAGFSPDPHSISIIAGGSNDVSTLNLAEGCVGWAASSPDYSVNLSADQPFLRLFFEGDGDTSLIVRTPGGEYLCNNDAFGTNPGVDITNATAGEYDVWVGTIDQSDFPSGDLYVTTSNAQDPATVGE